LRRVGHRDRHHRNHRRAGERLAPFKLQSRFGQEKSGGERGADAGVRTSLRLRRQVSKAWRDYGDRGKRARQPTPPNLFYYCLLVWNARGAP
jgi:hypothetical protein